MIISKIFKISNKSAKTILTYYTTITTQLRFNVQKIKNSERLYCSGHLVII